FENVWMVPVKSSPNRRTTGTTLHDAPPSFIEHLHESKRTSCPATRTLDNRTFRADVAVYDTNSGTGHESHGGLLHEICPAFTAIFRTKKEAVLYLVEWTTRSIEVTSTWNKLTLSNQFSNPLHSLGRNFDRGSIKHVGSYPNSNLGPGFLLTIGQVMSVFLPHYIQRKRRHLNINVIDLHFSFSSVHLVHHNLLRRANKPLLHKWRRKCRCP